MEIFLDYSPTLFGGSENPQDFCICSFPTPFIPLLPHTALGIKQIEKECGGGVLGGVGGRRPTGSRLRAGSLSSGFEDDGQRTLCKPSGFQLHSRVFHFDA